MKDKTVWRPVVGYEGFYEISNRGSTRRIRKDRKSILKIQKLKTGYRKVTLSKYGKSKDISIHRMVAQAFIPNPENKPCVNHKDGDKSNNSLNNLEWVTYRENTIHALNNGLRTAKKGPEHYAYNKDPHNKGIDNRMTKICIGCKIEYKTYVSTRKYCTKKCFQKHHVVWNKKIYENNE